MYKMKAGNWQVVTENTISYVEFYFEEPQPLFDSDPSLFVDGIRYEAEWLHDRQSLRAPVPDQQLYGIKEVLPPSLYFRSLRKARKLTPKKRKVSGDILPRVIAPDALSHGKYNVIRHDYDYGDEVLLLPGGTTPVEFRAAVYMPEDTVEAHSVIVFVHGVHWACYNEESHDFFQWPCRAGFVPKPSYEGYAELAYALASQGYAVVSVSAIGLLRESQDDSLRRGHLILAHLDLLADANNGTHPELSFLTGKLDLQNIGLMGHSRGGEGVARAITLNKVLDKGYGIRAAVLLGTTALQDIAIPDTHTAFILPFLDGDCIELDGQWVSDLSRYAFDDDVLRSSVLMLGANHNFYNSMWSPGIVGGFDDADETWGEVEVERLTQVEQRLLGSFYMGAFFRLILGREQQFLPLFDGSLVRLPILPTAEVRSSAHFPASSRYVIQSFETLYGEDTSLMPGNWMWDVKQGVGEIKMKAPIGSAPYRLRYAHDNLHSYLNLKSETPLAPAELELHTPEGGDPVDISIYTHLNFHVALLRGENPEEYVELNLSVGGATVDLTKTISYIRSVPEIIPGVETFLQQQVSVPLTDFPIDLSKPVDSVLITLPQGGNIYLSDIVFVKPSLGSISSIDLPFISLMGDMPIVATGDEQELEVQVFLSGRALSRVSFRIEFNIDHSSEGMMHFSERGELQPGEQSTTVTFTIPAGGFGSMYVGVGEDGSFHYIATVSLRALSNAVLDRASTRFMITPFP